MEILELYKSDEIFKHWELIYDTVSKPCDLIKLFILGVIYYISREWIFDYLLSKSIVISEETHYQFFYIFIE